MFNMRIFLGINMLGYEKPSRYTIRKGHKCYNCEELYHISKECPKDVDHAPTDVAPQNPKYVLKDTSGQLGDDRKCIL